MNKDAKELYTTIAKGLGFAEMESGKVNEEFEEFLLGVAPTSREEDTWLNRKSELQAPNNSQTIESILLSQVTGSQHGKYVDANGSSVLEAFLNLQWDSIMRDYSSRLSNAIQKGNFDTEFDKIINEIKETLIHKDKDGNIHSSATINDEGIILDGNNRVIKLKLFLAMQVAQVQFTPGLTDEEKSKKREELYEKYRIEVVRQKDAPYNDIERL